MMQLAKFEGYSDRFEVTEQTLMQRCFEREEFFVLIARTETEIVGILVYYFLPFTYDLTPWMLIKELYVLDAFRSLGVGKTLMQAAARACLKVGGARMRWEVLANNLFGQSFYQSLGAKHGADWHPYELDKTGIKNLVRKKKF